jgi:dihydroorotate dehydrogenase
MLPTPKPHDNPALRVTLWDRTFPNPVGLAAGFDKNAEIIGPMMQMGFGFVEAGTVTPKPQLGNKRPRVFRNTEYETIINRMGFPNCGMNKFKGNITNFLEKKPRPNGVLGINIGMNKSQTDPAKDYSLLIKQLGPLADYISINISSPNTPGLRDLQRREPLTELVNEIKSARKIACGEHSVPILIKLAPDMDDKQFGEVTATLIDTEIDGVILTNTTLDRPERMPDSFVREKGGLSGPYLHKKSTELIKEFYRLTRGRIPIIGLGGISTPYDAYEKIRAGASLIQLYTALVFKGPNVVNNICTGLERILEHDGFEHISEATGIDSGIKRKVAGH